MHSLNEALHLVNVTDDQTKFIVNSPRGKHAIAVGIDNDVDVEINGHVGYYCGGMNKTADIYISGNAGPGVAENIMSGKVVV